MTATFPFLCVLIPVIPLGIETPGPVGHFPKLQLSKLLTFLRLQQFSVEKGLAGIGARFSSVLMCGGGVGHARVVKH